MLERQCERMAMPVHENPAQLWSEIPILRQLESQRVPVKEVAVSPPTLDQVFLKHTGREMRVEEVKPMTRAGFRRGGRQ